MYFKSFLPKNLKRSEGALTHVYLVRLVYPNFALYLIPLVALYSTKHGYSKTETNPEYYVLVSAAMSLINLENHIGPNMPPCSTPDITCTIRDYSLSTMLSTDTSLARLC